MIKSIRAEVGKEKFYFLSLFFFPQVLVLVLSVGVQGEHQEQLMTPALSLDQRSQVEIMNILKEIVSDCPNKLNLDNLLACRSGESTQSLFSFLIPVATLFLKEEEKKISFLAVCAYFCFQTKLMFKILFVSFYFSFLI